MHQTKIINFLKVYFKENWVILTYQINHNGLFKYLEITQLRFKDNLKIVQFDTTLAIRWVENINDHYFPFTAVIF